MLRVREHTGSESFLARMGVFGYDCRAFREPAPARRGDRAAGAGVGTAAGAVSRPTRGYEGELQRGSSQLGLLLADIVHALENPFVAAVAGLVFAAVLIHASRVSFRLVTPVRPVGMALAALALFGRLAIATGALWAYKAFAPAGIRPFALTFAGGFLTLYTIELVRYAGLWKYRRPVGAGR